MAFADWVKRSELAATALSRCASFRTVLQAAYKAGERQGRNDAEEIAQRAVCMAVALEREACAALCMTFDDTHEANRGHGPTMCADAIRLRSNVGDDRQTAPVAKQPSDAVCPRRSTS